MRQIFIHQTLIILLNLTTNSALFWHRYNILSSWQPHLPIYCSNTSYHGLFDTHDEVCYYIQFHYNYLASMIEECNQDTHKFCVYFSLMSYFAENNSQHLLQYFPSLISLVPMFPLHNLSI